MSDFILTIKPKADAISVQMDIPYASIVRWFGRLCEWIGVLVLALTLRGDTGYRKGTNGNGGSASHCVEKLATGVD